MSNLKDPELPIRQLEDSYKRRALEALDALGHSDETLAAYGMFLDRAQELTPAQIDELRGTPEGEAVAETIVKIQRLHWMTRPVVAGGWRRMSRWMMMLLLAGGGAIAAVNYTFPFGSLFAGAVGLATATIINWAWLGGRPERRYAVEALLTPRSQRLWKEVSKKVGPPPAETSLCRLEAEMTPTQSD